MKRILVTGANKGIGLAIVEAIVAEDDDTFAFLGSRNAGRGEAARERLRQAHPDWADRIEVVPLDVSNDDSVAAAAKQIATRLGGATLSAVVNNAGIGFGPYDLRTVLEVNTFGIRRVCESFVPLLGDGGRIVNVTSAAGPMFVAKCSAARQAFFVDTRTTWPQLRAFVDECLALRDREAFAAAGLGAGDAYGLSKACANVYTMLLARENPGLKINACTPGFIETDMTRRLSESAGKSPAQMGMRPPSEGTRAPMFLLFGEPEGTGHYYGSDAVRSPLDRYRGPGDPPYTGT